MDKSENKGEPKRERTSQVPKGIENTDENKDGLSTSENEQGTAFVGDQENAEGENNQKEMFIDNGELDCDEEILPRDRRKSINDGFIVDDLQYYKKGKLYYGTVSVIWILSMATRLYDIAQPPKIW